MNLEALERAKKGLQIIDVYLASSNSHLAPSFDPKFDARANSLQAQLKHVVRRSYLIEGGIDKAEIVIFRVEVEVGARMLPSEHGSEEIETVLAQIEAVYMADYQVVIESLKNDREALDTFAVKNASYHVWPYWREFLASHAKRMNLPPFTLPIMQLAENKGAGPKAS